MRHSRDAAPTKGQGTARDDRVLGDPPLEESTPEAVRALRASRLRPPTVTLAEIRDVDAGGVPARLYRPSAEPGLGLLVFLHGGGWVLGNLDTHDNLARALADEVAAPSSRSTTGWLPSIRSPPVCRTRSRRPHGRARTPRRSAATPARLAIGGDSAGANLAAVVTQAGTIPFRFQLLVYPVTDARGGSASYEAQKDGPWLTEAGMHWFVGHYLSGGDGALDDPRVSPLLAADGALANSPPTLVITAELDPLRDEGEAYAERLRSLGVPVDVTRYEGMFHGFCSFADLLDDGRRAVSQAAAALAGALGAPAQAGRPAATS